jgi:predicted ATPase
LATAHGGQVVATNATTSLLENFLPGIGASLLDLGEHRLKDLTSPEHIYQVCSEDLPSDFPPIVSLDNPALSHNLPAQVSTFIGRSRELSEIRSLLGEARVVTLTGAGGVGKTRLALHVAVELLDGRGDGVWFVDFSPLSEPELVAKTAAEALGVSQELGRPLLDTLAEHLRNKEMLLILDNCEHVVGPVAKLVQRISADCPTVALLATSREPLGVTGEHIYRVPSLSMPDLDELDPSVPGSSESVLLFCERASEHRSTFVLDDETLRSISRICAHLDGLPLAIELAAGRLRSLSVSDIESRLDQRFRLLTAGLRTALPRHQTLQAMIDWSYDLLNPPERTVLERLSVFAGGFDLEAAELVASGGEVDETSVIDILSSLVDKSLVQAEGSEQIRYRLLETVRQYGVAKLELSAEEKRIQVSHRDYFLALAELASSRFSGPEGSSWFKRMSLEHDNLRIALVTSFDDPDAAPGLRLAFALYNFWAVMGHAVEGVRTLRLHLDRPESQEPSVLRGKALIALALVLGAVLGDHYSSLDYAAEGLEIGRNQNDDYIKAQALRQLAISNNYLGNFDRAYEFANAALKPAQALGNKSIVASMHLERGYALQNLGKNPLSDWQIALDTFREVGNLFSVVFMLANIGHWQLLRNRDTARTYLGDSLELAREVGNRQGICYALSYLGTLEYLEDRDDLALPLLVESLTMAYEDANSSVVANTELNIALTESRSGDPRVAATIHGAADGLYEQLGEKIETAESQLREADHARLKEQLGSSDFQAAYEEGRLLSLGEGVALALSCENSRSQLRS